MALELIPRPTGTFEERYSRTGVVDRRDGEIRVTITGEIVARRPETLSDIASFSAQIALREFGSCPRGTYKLDACTDFGQKNDSLSSFRGPKIPDEAEKTTRAIQEIQQRILQHSGLQAMVRVIWDNNK